MSQKIREIKLRECRLLGDGGGERRLGDGGEHARLGGDGSGKPLQALRWFDRTEKMTGLDNVDHGLSAARRHERFLDPARLQKIDGTTGVILPVHNLLAFISDDGGACSSPGQERVNVKPVAAHAPRHKLNA
jgi:hypothetical protein